MSNYKQLKAKAYETIKQKILNNELGQGQYLEEKMLCEMVGASRTPIREAINILEQENLVQVIPGKGIFTTALSVQNVKELFQMRRLLEPMALQMAYKNLNSDILLKLKAQFSDEMRDRNYPHLHQLDYKLHNYINENCSNSYMVKIMQMLSDQFQRVRTQPFYAEQRTLGGAQEHLKLIDIIISEEIDGAKQLLIEHISNTERYYFKSLSGAE